MTDELMCQACGGNDMDTPCAYPGTNEYRAGCLRRERLRRDALGRAMDALADAGREFEVAGESLQAIGCGQMAATIRHWYHAQKSFDEHDPHYWHDDCSSCPGSDSGSKAKRHPCPCPEVMGEFACQDKAQCWEPCGDLGKSEAHAEAVPKA